MKIHPTSSSISIGSSRIGSSRGGGGVSTVEIYIYIYMNTVYHPNCQPAGRLLDEVFIFS